MPTDHISIVEAAYDLHVDDETWLHQIASRTSSVFPKSKGSIAHFYDPCSLKRSILDSLQHASADPKAFEHIVRETHDADENLIEAVYKNQQKPFCRPASQFYRYEENESPRVDVAPQFADPKFRRFGLRDMFGIFAELPDGSGCMIATLLENVIRPAPRTIWLWNRIAIHLAAGLRLRRALQTDSNSFEDCPIFHTNGDIHYLPSEIASDADSESLTLQLRQQVINVETARKKSHRSSANDALDLWTGLLDGRWSLIDQFTTNGIRRVVARRNDPQYPDPRALSPIERQVVNLVARGRDFKNIVYELGLRPGSRSVETHLNRALKKLNLKNRSELMQLILPVLQQFDNQLQEIGSSGLNIPNNTVSDFE